MVADASVEKLPESFEQRISRQAMKFDLRPLLDVLREHGYAANDILFEGSAEDAASPGIVEALRFPEKPEHSVIITLNLGLLAEGSLLPAYFFDVIQSSARSGAFYDFVRFFDHRLVENYLWGIYPEDSGGLYGDYNRLLWSYLRMLGPGSLTSLAWLFQRYFPDFPVHVSRREFASDTAAHAMMMGSSKLDGTGVLGKIYPSENAGFVVELTTEYETDLYGRLWADIILDRFRQRLLPLLEPFRIPLAVRLRVLWHTGYAKLEDPRKATKGRLGYDRIRDKEPSPHTIMLFPELPDKLEIK
jgi:hypothetical protein